MKIYVDLVLILNFLIDLLLLMSVKIILRRRTTVFRLILSSFIGSLTILLLFLNLNTLIFKLIISIIMLIVGFEFRDIRFFIKNFICFYLISIILGGFMYYLNLEFSYKNIGLIFINKGLSINFIFILLISPIIIFIYIKQNLNLKNNYNNYYKLKVYFEDDKVKEYIGYLDTGNKLKDPYKNRPIILINDFKNDYKKILVPCKTVNSFDLLECFKVKKIFINNKYIKNVLIGISKNKIDIDGVDCILNPLIIKENI